MYNNNRGQSLLEKIFSNISVKGATIGVIVFIVLFIALPMFVGWKVIEPGYTGVEINRLGAERGVSKDNIVSGFTMYLKPSTRVVSYPTYIQRVVWTHDVKEGRAVNEELTFNTKDSVPVNMDVAVSYQLDATRVPEFYTKFRADNIDNFTHGFLRDTTRNIVVNFGSEYTFDEVNGAKKEEFMAKISAELHKQVGAYGVSIQQFGLTGSLRPPQALLNAVNAKTEAIQKSIQVENEVRQAEAEAKKKVAIANGEAAANRALASSIDPKLLEWERLKIQRDQVAKWNGALPTTMLGGGNNPLIYNLK